MHFCHIAPSELTPLAASQSTCYLTLAHLIEKDPVYCKQQMEASQRARKEGKDVVKIMDNSAFEYYKEHGPGYVFDPSKLIKLGHAVEADYIVLPDYPGEASNETIKAAQQYSKQFIEEGFGTFFVPQSKPGDVDDYISAFEWAAGDNGIDYIGISILGAPIAFDVEANNQLNRFFSRWKIMSILDDKGLLYKAKQNSKKIHFLGMVDGPNEIELVKPFWRYIDSWDTSSAVWSAICGKRYDNSPTGLINGKIETPVDFSWPISNITAKILDDIQYNIDYINARVEMTNRPSPLVW